MNPKTPLPQAEVERIREEARAYVKLWFGTLDDPTGSCMNEWLEPYIAGATAEALRAREREEALKDEYWKASRKGYGREYSYVDRADYESSKSQKQTEGEGE